MDEQTTAQPNDKKFASEYGGLGRLLHIVRWTKHLLAIIAEVLILLSFAMSGMDVSLGGVMAGVPLLKVLWAAMFALGIDTAFALSWVRLRQCAIRRQWLPFVWNLLLALAMSVIVFQPLAIQLLQQSLDLNFAQAVTNLGINIVFLTYARSAVAVFLGAILAMTNVESAMVGHAEQGSVQPKRKIILLERVLNKVAPVISSDNAVPAQPAQITIAEAVPAQTPVTAAQDDADLRTMQQLRAQKVSEADLSGLSGYERVIKVLSLFPDVSDRELGKLSKLSAATAKKHKEALQHAQSIEHAHSNKTGGHG
jgi:hypothetical protein